MSTPLLTSFVSHNETQNLKILTTRISSAPIRTLTSTKQNTNFSSNSFTSLKANDTKYNSTNHSEPLERFTISYVIKRGYFNLVRYLLSLGIDPNHASVKESYPDMYTPLIYCTFIKDEKWALSVAQNLLEHGADLKKTDVNKLNPIHYCCAFGLESLLNLFLNSIDFDLSRSLDSNGNNCMHYAIRSHNLNCVKLIIDKFKPNEMYKKIDLKNSLSLKPSQIEDEINFNSIKYFNYKFPGHDSLEMCREALTNFIKEHHILRTKPIIQPKLIESDTESKLKKESKSKNKRSNKLKTKKNSAKSSTASLQQQNEKSEFKSTFFQTEIEPIIEETRAVSVAVTTTSPKSKPKKKTSKSSKSSKDEPIIEQIIIEPVLQQPEDIISEKIEKEEKPIDKEKAKYLTSKSFIISLKERLSNLITFSDLFVAREHMFQSVILGNDQSKPKLRSGPLKPDIKIYKDSCKSASEGFSYMEPVKTWKTTLPNMFVSLESFLTPSYRETVQPMSNSPNFFKRSLKKASKKSSSNLDSSFRSNTSKRLISSSKIERKTSTPHLIQKINEYEGGN